MHHRHTRNHQRLIAGIKCGEHAAVGRCQSTASARHHALGDVEEFLLRHAGEAGGRALAERFHKVSRKASTMHVHPDAQYSGCIEHRVNASLGVVAHNQTAELQRRAGKAARRIIPEADGRIVVLEIGRHRACAYVAPFPNHGISKETIMSLIGIALKYNIVYLLPPCSRGRW